MRRMNIKYLPYLTWNHAYISYDNTAGSGVAAQASTAFSCSMSWHAHRMQTLIHCVSETVQSLPPPPCTTCPTLLKQMSAWEGQSSCFWPLQVPSLPIPTAQGLT